MISLKELITPALALALTTPSWAGVNIPYAPHGQYLLKVMSYNIKGLPLPWLKHKYRYANIGKEVAKFRQSGVGPAILGLQEAFVKKTGDLGKEVGMPYKARGPGRRGIRINSGLEVLSDYPITSSKTVRYKKCSGTDCLANKGAIFSRIEVPGLPSPIDFYNTHMNAGGQASCQRMHQAEQLVDLIRDTHEPGNILISMGDFNFKPDSDEYDYYSRELNLINSAYECGVVQNCQGHADPMHDWSRSIDHVFYQETPFIKVTPVYYQKLLHDETNASRWSDHDALATHYLIEW